MKNVILIPAYEPDEKLINLVTNLSYEDFEIVVVDDGSGLSYKNIFDKCKDYVSVISYDINRGKGFALKKGFEYIKNKYIDNFVVVTMDCDGQHTIADAKKLMKECECNKDTLYLGKRVRSKKTPVRSRMGNAITRFVYKMVAGLDIYDTQTGLRAFSSDLIDYLIDIDGDRYEYEMNVLLSFARDKMNIKEIEIETIYIDNNSGSHFNGFADSYRIYKDIIMFNKKWKSR